MEGVGFIPQLSEPIDETFQQVAEEVAVAACALPEWKPKRPFSKARRAEVLVEAAADADLLVVGTRGHGGFAGLLWARQRPVRASCGLPARHRAQRGVDVAPCGSVFHGPHSLTYTASTPACEETPPVAPKPAVSASRDRTL